MGLIDNPRVFYETIHPRQASGWIVVRRKLPGKRRTEARIPANQMATLANSAVGLPDLSFSAANFYGRPLLLNFAETRCLYAHIATSDGSTSDFIYDTYSYLASLGLPLPNTIIQHPRSAVLLWVVDKPYRSQDIPKLALVQQTLRHLLIGFGAQQETNEITSLLPLPGTQAGLSGLFTTISAYKPEPVTRGRLENAVLETVPASSLEHMHFRGSVLTELQLLWHNRSLDMHMEHKRHIDWLIFFGASLAMFCSPKQLRAELIAVAESLTGHYWKDIAADYKALIDPISSTASEGLIEIDGHQLSVNYPGWEQMIAGRLEVSSTESRDLGLRVLTDATNGASFTNIHYLPQSPTVFGADTFVPLRRLLLRNAA